MSAPTANNHSWYSTKNDGLNQRGVSPSPQLYNRTVQHQSSFHPNAYTWQQQQQQTQQQQQQVPPPSTPQQQQYSWYNPNQHLKPSGAVTPQMNSSANTGDAWQWGTNTAYQQQHHHQQLQQQQHHYGQYQQQTTQQYATEYRNAASTNSDPWNWGWDESANSGNTEPQNNNAAADPTWNWSVEGSANYQESNIANANYTYGSVQQTPYSVAKTDLPSNVPTYGQESQSHGAVYTNSTFASVTESFQSSQPGSLSLYGHNHQSQASQPVGNENAERYHSGNRTDIVPNNTAPTVDQSNQYSNVFHENKQSTTSMVPTIKQEYYDQGYQDNAPPAPQVTANEPSNIETVDRLSSVGDGTSIETKTENVVESRSSEDASVLQKQIDANQEDKRVEEYLDSHSPVLEDNSKLNSTSGLPSQWSTESLPSQGSDDISQTLEGSSRSEGPSSLSAVSQSPSITEPAPHSDTAEQQETKNKQQGLSSHSNPNYAHVQENVRENQHAQASSSYRYNSSVPQPQCFVRKDLYSNTQVEASASLESITSGVKSMVLTSNESSASPDVENKEIVFPEGEAKAENVLRVGSSVAAPPPRNMPLAQGQSQNPYAKPRGPLTHKYRSSSPVGEGASAIDRRTYSSENTGKVSQFSSLPEVMSQTINNLISTPYSAGSKHGDTVTGYSSKSKKPVTPPITEEAVNLETVPDNKERPDNVDLQQPSKPERKLSSPSITGPRLHPVPVGQDANRTVPQWNQPASYNASPENQEVAPRCGPDRNQYLETGQLLEDESHNLNTSLTSEGFLPPPGLHRMVPGQLTEQGSVANNFMPENNVTNSFGEDISTPPPGLRRLVPGQFTEHENIPSQEADESAISESAGDALFQRMVPGQLTEEGGGGNFASEDASDGAAPANDVPPPGLRRMIPGESSSPESQGNAALLAQTGTPSGTFQPINALPLEPRVVTGVAQDEIDGVGSVATLQITSSPMSSGSRVKSEPESPVPEPTTNSNSLPQPPSERSETIGSDSVETYPPPPADNAKRDSSSRRDNVTKDRDRRHRDEQDGKELDASQHRRRQTDGGNYYPHRDKDRDESPEGNRYRDRDDREWKPYDPRHDRDRDDSPGGDRYRDERDRRHYDSRHDYRRSRHKSSYDRHEDDADTEDYYSDPDRDKSGYGDPYDRYRPRSDRERHREVYDKSRRKSDIRGSGRERDRERDPDLVRDRDHLLERDRDRDKDRTRDRNRDRDRLREREKDRRRQDYYPERPDYRRGDGYYGRYEDDPYYREHSRPSSRSGSHAEYDEYWRRDYHAYGAYYYNYYENLRRTNPAAYAEWYAKVYLAQQQNYNQGSVSEDRGSVHSGRSSANDDRFHRPGHSQANRYLNTSFTGSYNGRAPEQNDSFLAEEVTTATTPQRLTPAKFSTAHVKGVFTESGQFLKVLPHYPLDGQSAMVEIHDVGGLLDGSENKKELLDFPGPLVRGVTHKNSIITFCTRKIKKAEHDLELYDRESVILLWRLLVLLLRQNGTVVGTDIAELLLSNSSHPEAATSSSTISVRPSPATSQHDVHQDDGPLTQPPPTKTEEEITNEFREYLLYGNTKEALEWAMKHGLWGHALFLASKMDQRTYANVMMRFANGLPMNDPLQTLYQLMSGRQPAAVTCCADEKWGDWKPHLAMILSNTSQRPELEHKAITTLGDTLAARGCLHAAHFCYLMAQLEFGSYTQKSSKIVLLGSSHAKPFYEFASNEAIQMTEIYIYSCQLADPEFNLPQFQAYKFLYALRLAEQGMAAEAIHYIEVIAGTILQRPTSYNVHFIKEVYELGDRLKYYDPVYTNIESEELESADPAWLVGLRNVIENYSMGLIQQEVPSYGSLSNLSTSEADPSQHVMSGMGQNYQETVQVGGQWPQDQVNYYQNQQAYWQQQSQQQIQQGQSQGVEGVNEGYQTEPIDDQNKQATDPYWQNSHWTQETMYSETVQQNQDESIQTATTDVSSQQWQEEQQTQHQPEQQQQQQAAFNYWDMSPSQGEDTPRVTLPGTTTESVSQHRPPSPPKPEKKVPAKQKTKEDSTKPSQQTNSWWIGGIWNKISLRPKNQMKLPDDKNPSIVWDPDKKRWTNLDEDGDDGTSSLPPPPKASELPSSKATTQQNAPTESVGTTAPPSSSNMYKLGGPGKGRKPKYVDVLSGSKATNQSIPAPELFPPVSTQQTSVNYFVPAPVEANANDPADFISGGGEVTSNAHESQTTDNSQLSRWSSTSSLSREVQKYTMRGQQQHSLSKSMAAMEHQSAYGAPMMFDPTSFSQQANVAKSSGTLGRKRYPNN